MKTNENVNTAQSPKKKLIIITACILAVAIVAVTVAAVVGFNLNKVKDPVLQYERAKLPLTFYSLMLSRTKASLARSGYDVTSTKFWNAESPAEGKTNAEYYTERTLETCKLYLLSVYLFDKEGLKLPKTYYDMIDEEIDDCINLSYIGNGSEDKLNEILGRYGADIESYREALIIKSKAEYLQLYLFGEGGSKIGADLKDEYYKAHYERFKQILIANYYYTYETDEFGNEMYFTADLTKTLYDSKNGVVGIDENNEYLYDKYDQRIYFEKDADGKPILDKPLYDKENGVRQPVCDEDGNAIKNYYSDAEMAKREALAKEISESIGKDNFAAFESEMEKLNDARDGAALNPDGYYLNDITSDGYGGYDYLNKIFAELRGMAVGENRVVSTSEGYHIVMKYSLDDGAYDDEDKSAWFDNFVPTIMTEVFKNKYSDILQNIEIIEENLAKAESIKIAGINYDYWR